MSRPILHQANKVAGFLQMADYLLSHDDVFAFIAPADVVDLSWLASEKYMFDRRTMVLHGQPIAALASIPIERKGLVIDRIGDEQWNEFLRILIRPIGIAAPRHHHREPIGRPVAEGQEVSAGFAGCIGTSRSQAIGFDRHPGLDAAVNFVRADLQKSLQAGTTSFFKQHAGPHHIGSCKGSRIENRPIDMSLRRSVDDPFNPMRTNETLDQGLIANISMHKCMPGMLFDRLKICEIAGVFQGIEIHHLMAALRNQTTDEMRPDESSPSGYEDTHTIKAKVEVKFA